MTKTLLAFTLEAGEVCHSCGQTENVLMANIGRMPPTCVVCLFRLIDVPMEWRLSNTAIQTLAHRAHSGEIHAEQERMESKLPVELRRKSARQ